MTIFELCGLFLIIAGLAGFAFKRNILANGISFQIIVLGLILLASRGFAHEFSRSSFMLTCFLLFLANIFFMIFIATIYRVVKDYYLKEEV